MWLITFEDDASRKIVSWSVFDHATSEHSVEILKEGIKTHARPREVLSGHDAQFYANKAEGKVEIETIFHIFLKEQGIKHIVGGINHPQTNGKQERLFGTMKSKLDEFDSMADLINWYNEIKPHMGLDFDNLETPSQAFVCKMHHSAKGKPVGQRCDASAMPDSSKGARGLPASMSATVSAPALLNGWLLRFRHACASPLHLSSELPRRILRKGLCRRPQSCP